jgi:hypothetical protein
MLLVCSVLAFRSGGAQSAQPYSLQISGLGGLLRFRDTLQVGTGGEAQLRFNHVAVSSAGVLSIGVGAQYTHHQFAAGQSFDVEGAFIEPRYAIAGSSERFFPYFALRGGVLRQSSNVVNSSYGYAAGGGGGIGYALGRHVNLDIGAIVLVQKFGDTKITATNAPYSFDTMLGLAVKAGLSIGF